MPRNDPKGFQPLENSDISKKKKSSSSTIDRIVDLLAGNSQQNDSSSLEEDYGRNALSKESSLLQNHGKKLEKGREGKKIGGIVNPEFRNGDQVKGETKNSQSFTKENQNTVTKPNVILSRNGNSNCRKVGRKPVAKGSRDKSSDIKADLWWLHFLYVIVVLIQRGSNHEGQSGLYTLKTTSHESDPIDSSCTVAFEDCEPGDFSADIVPLLIKDLHEVVDPTFFSCLLQPSSADSDPQYIGICHLLLYRKAKSGVHRWKDWRCNGKGYVAYWNYIGRPRNWESLHAPSQLKHSWSKGNLLVDASVGDGFRLQLHSPFCLRWITGVSVGTYEVAIKLQVTRSVSAQVQVTTISQFEMFNLHIPL
uniref:Uncharacterized protein n=1 Tax=Vitis vinifera TaxID=29760 RepID=F6I3I8_VITVI